MVCGSLFIPTAQRPLVSPAQEATHEDDATELAVAFIFAGVVALCAALIFVPFVVKPNLPSANPKHPNGSTYSDGIDPTSLLPKYSSAGVMSSEGDPSSGTQVANHSTMMRPSSIRPSIPGRSSVIMNAKMSLIANPLTLDGMAASRAHRASSLGSDTAGQQLVSSVRGTALGTALSCPPSPASFRHPPHLSRPMPPL